MSNSTVSVWRSGWLAVLTLAAVASPAAALKIELKDVANDRIERQRAAAAGALPLAGTPNIAILDQRLRDAGVTKSDRVVVRLFKAESELEIWKERDGEFILFATYPVCHWSGSLGPKLAQGDKQTPEGFYTVARRQTHGSARWPHSLNIGYPNVLDQAQARTGSHILIHGGCSSIGCFAMTNSVMDEIYELTTEAIKAGQKHIPVHSLPFRMTDENMKQNNQSPWLEAWKNLKEGYDLFEKTRRPPKVRVCNGRYIFEETKVGELAGELGACPETLATIREQEQWLKNVPRPSAAEMRRSRFGNDRSTQFYKPPKIRCNLRRPSCKKWVTLQTRIAIKKARLAARQQKVAERRVRRAYPGS